MTAYQFWFKSQWGAVGSDKLPIDAAQLIKTAWDELPDDKRWPFTEAAEADSERFSEELEQWNTSKRESLSHRDGEHIACRSAPAAAPSSSFAVTALAADVGGVPKAGEDGRSSLRATAKAWGPASSTSGRSGSNICVVGTLRERPADDGYQLRTCCVCTKWARCKEECQNCCRGVCRDCVRYMGITPGTGLWTCPDCLRGSSSDSETSYSDDDDSETFYAPTEVRSRTIAARCTRNSFVCAACKCSLSGKGWRCAQCKSVTYCGAKCQARHWPVHKRSCNSAAASSGQ